MSDFTLPDGRAVDFDLMQITMDEYREFSSGSLLNKQDNDLLARVTGLSAAEVGKLPQPVYRRLIKAFYKVATSPLDDTDDPKA